MSQPKTLRRLISELEKYFRIYGDIPCYVAIGETIAPLTDSALGSAYPDEYTQENTPVSMNIVILCDHDAYRTAQKESDENEALEDSTYGE